MKTIITYGSNYGSAERYAKKLSEIIGAEAVSYKNVKSLKDFSRVIHVGSLFGGEVLGLNKIIKKLPKSAEFYVATVGLTDVKDESNRQMIENGLKRQMPEELFKTTIFCYLRGGIFYSRLKFTHKIMMKILYKALSSKPESERSVGVNNLLDTYNKDVDFVDFKKLQEFSEIL